MPWLSSTYSPTASALKVAARHLFSRSSLGQGRGRTTSTCSAHCFVFAADCARSPRTSSLRMNAVARQMAPALPACKGYGKLAAVCFCHGCLRATSFRLLPLPLCIALAMPAQAARRERGLASVPDRGRGAPLRRRPAPDGHPSSAHPAHRHRRRQARGQPGHRGDLPGQRLAAAAATSSCTPTS